ncbi:MAG: helix-turn-helix domain-containing protein [Cyanobacteria bacterium P01_D01_bin.36]
MTHIDSDFLQPPQQRRSQIRVEQILQAAAEIFWEKGYDVATTSDIAKRAQTAVGTLYRFFPNKLAIFIYSKSGISNTSTRLSLN